MADPIFLLSSERSGTNFLRRLIGKHSRIDDPVPIHFLKWLYPAAVFFGDLKKDENFEKLIKEAKGLATYHFSPWKVELPDKIFFDIPPQERSVMAVFHKMYQFHAEQQGRKRYICKDNHLFDFLYPIDRYFSNPKYIYLYRDPRDYALSQKKRTLMTNDLYSIATLWRDEQFKCFQALADSEIRERTFVISYEELVSDEQKSIKNMLEFLGEEYFEGKGGNQEEQTIEEWKNLDKETLNTNFNKYQRELKHSEVSLIEEVCWNPMKYLGYQTENHSRPSFPTSQVLLKRLKGRLRDSFSSRGRKFSKKEMERRENRKKLLQRLKRDYY